MTSCYLCLSTIRVPIEVFEDKPTAVCRDAGHPCHAPVVIR